MFVLSLLYLVCTIIRPQDYMPELVGVPLLQVVLVLAFLAWLS
jgi:putative inorganic carbon (HCO3(-)) transporter